MSHRALALVFACCLACSSDSGREADASTLDASSREDAARPGSDSGAAADGGGASGASGAAGASGASGAGGASGSGGASGASGSGGAVPRDDDAGPSDDAGIALAPLRILVFSKTTGFRHESIGPATAALAAIADRIGAAFEATEDAALMIGKLAATDVVVFMMTTGDVLDDAQQTAFESYMRAGGGFVGVHSAADTEYGWPFYRELNGAWFAGHPATQPAKVIVDAPDNPLVSFLPREWMRTDEWYNFVDNPRARGVTVLLRLDEASYSGGTMGGDHPIAWSHSVGEGRAFYTGIGHTVESWEEGLVLQHVERGVVWAGRRP